MASGDLRRIVVPNVIVRIGNENIGRMTGKQTIVLNEENKGRLLDGREVIKIDDQWYYIPRGGV